MGESICWKPPHRFLIIFHVVCHLGLWHKKQNSVWGKLFFFTLPLSLCYSMFRETRAWKGSGIERAISCVWELSLSVFVQMTPSIFRLYGDCEVFMLGWKIEYKQVFLILKISWFSSMVLFEPRFLNVVHWHIWISLFIVTTRKFVIGPTADDSKTTELCVVFKLLA